MVDVFTTNDCVYCPQGCIHCGRDKDYRVITYTCDGCMENGELLELFKTETGKQLCEKCYVKNYIKKISADLIIEELENADVLNGFTDYLLENAECVNDEYEK